MTTITLLTDDSEVVRGIRGYGHSGYDEIGRDIVCSAISVLVINLANSVESFTEDKFSYKIVEKSGDFSFLIEGEISKESILLIKSCVLGLKSIAGEYGKKFITIKHGKIDSSRR